MHQPSKQCVRHRADDGRAARAPCAQTPPDVRFVSSVLGRLSRACLGKRPFHIVLPLCKKNSATNRRCCVFRPSFRVPMAPNISPFLKMIVGDMLERGRLPPSSTRSSGYSAVRRGIFPPAGAFAFGLPSWSIAVRSKSVISLLRRNPRPGTTCANTLTCRHEDDSTRQNMHAMTRNA